MTGLWRLWKERATLAEEDASYAELAPAVITSLAGFIVAAQFVTLEGLEIPYYVALLGAGTLKLSSVPDPEHAADDTPSMATELTS